MRLRAAAILTISGLWAVAAPAAQAGSCSAHSGPKTAALVELYTSEGCSSCPPADQTLARLRQVLGAGAEGFGLALHVDYWDYMGWHDPWAQQIFSQRHQWLVEVNHQRVVYTPHFFVNGTELPPGQSGLREQVRDVNAQPAQAQIELSADRTVPGTFTLDAVAQASSGVDTAALYIALAENGLASNVLRGENAGRKLTHEHVARVWIGPIALSNGEVRVHRALPLPDRATDAQWELTAFVQEQRTGKVLQALALQACPQF